MSDETQTTESRNGPRWGRWLSIVVVLAVLVGIGVSLVRMIPITHRYYTDADTIKTPAGDAQTRDILWQPPKRLAEVVNTRSDDYEPRFSADGLTLYFVRGKAGENADIYVTNRTYEGWSQPEPLTALNTDYEDLGPEPSADGQSLYFYSDRPGGLGGYDLWVAHRSREGWQDPINLGPLVNSEFNDYGPAVTPDGKTLYFSSNRPLPQDVDQPDPNAWPATIREDLFHRTYDLYRASITDGGFGGAEVLTGLNSPYNEGAPAVSSFGDFLYFASDRPGGEGGFDLYRSRRLRDEHRPVENLGPTVNTHANELDPGLGLGGFALIFSSDATTADPRADAPREYDLCYTTSREVFTDVDRVPRQPLNWAALWETVLPNLLWALLALLALLLMLALLRDVRGRRLSLLAKCLLASLMAHLLLLLLFNVWEVTATLAREFRRGGPIQIALASPAAGDSLARQVRGQLTDIDAPTPIEMPRERQTAPVEVEASPTMASLSVQRGTIEMPEEVEADVTTDDATIEQRIEPPPLPELQTDTRPAVTLDMALPAERERVRETESDSSEQASPVNTQPPARPSVAVAVSRPVEAADDIARIPPSFDTNEAPPDARTLAVTSPGREALPHASATIDTTSTLASLDVPRMTDLPLPQAPVDRMPELTEAAPRITVPATAAPRYDLPDNVLSQAPTGLAVSIEPEVTGTTLDDSTFADTPTAHAMEVAVAGEFIDPHAAAAPEPTVPKMAEIDLADLEATAAAHTTESTPEPAHASTEPPRRVLPSEAMLQVEHERQVSIDPQSIEAANDGSSLASQPDENAPEAAPSDEWADSRMTPRADPTLPRSFDLALAELETLPGSAAAESPVELTARNIDRLRPDLTEKVTPDVNRPTQVSFNPRPANAVPAATSLATESTRHAGEMTPGYESSSTSSVLHAEAVLPSLEDIALPDLEQSSTSYRGEVSPDVNWVASTAPRASLSGSLTSTENTTPTPTFDIPLTARETAEDSPTSLAELPTGNRDIDRLALAAATPSSTPDLLIPETPDLSLSLPAEVIPPSNPYAQRSAPDRLTMVERMGGSEETERAVAAALAWLARHQSEDGHWDGEDFDEECGGCGGETEVAVDHALTGLALLCFYGAGHTHADDGPYRENIERGLRWLVARQSPDGDLRGEETMYTQGIATIAVSEAFGMTHDSSLAEPIHLAVRFIDRARNTRVGGWRYDPGQVGDTSVLGWQVMALKSASLNGIATPAASFKAARDWLDLVSHPSRPGRYAYQPGRGYTPAMTAEGMFAQQLLGLSREDPRMQASAEYLADHLPDWEDAPNTYYWYYGTLALFQHQGEPWRVWNETLTEQLLEHQRKDGPAAGSWDPKGEWADIGGRIYQTTLCTLMLEVYYRYLPLYTLDGSVDPIGSIRGLVSDASTGSALPGATVRLVLPDREPVTVTTGNDGGYTLMAPEVPDFFALSASLDGYLPSTANVDSAMVQGTTLAVDFQLAPEDLTTVAMESVPDVHHLGDDNFDGTINSQFQKKSEGSTFTAEFELSEAQLPPYFNEAEVTLMAKGVQRRHTIRINGVVLEDRLDDAPSDGSFGEFNASFDIAILEAGTNTFEVIARPSTSDIDDFEFVNIQINLSP